MGKGEVLFIVSDGAEELNALSVVAVRSAER